MELIYGLPPEIAAVPPSPNRPDDPDAPTKKAAWEQWSLKVRAYRSQTVELAVKHPAIADWEWKKCAADPAYFITIYGHLFEPRAKGRKGGVIPWIPFERQVQMIRWWQDCMANEEDENADGISSKARDVGASWTFCALMVWGFLFEPVFTALCASRNELLVDSKSPKSLFWKIDKFMSMLPTFLMPPGFNPVQHRQKLILRHPSKDNYITGESTNKGIGVGDRVTMIFFDEAARIPDFLNVWMNTAETSDHRFACSTENMEEGPDFYNLARGIDVDYSPAPFPFDWWQHPLHDYAWYEERKRRIPDEEAFQREIERNPFGASYFVYPPAREKTTRPEIAYLPGSPLWCSIDPGFEDATAIVWLQYNAEAERYEVINGYSNNKMPAAFYAGILSGSVMDLHGNPIEDGFAYGPYEEEVMAWVRSIGHEKFRYFGDMAGEQRNMAARNADSVYSVIRDLTDIRILADRTPTGKSPAYRMIAREHKGRREAMRFFLPRLEFGDTRGCREALYALQNNRFSAPRTGRIPESGMFRDSTTHYTSALEYWAANMKIELDLTEMYENRAERAKARRKEDVVRSRIRRMAGVR